MRAISSNIMKTQQAMLRSQRLPQRDQASYLRSKVSMLGLKNSLQQSTLRAMS